LKTQQQPLEMKFLLFYNKSILFHLAFVEIYIVSCQVTIILPQEGGGGFCSECITSDHSSKHLHSPETASHRIVPGQAVKEFTTR
jgi:hypothetical protein